MNINLHIEKLILDGVNITREQSDLVKASVTTELTQLLNRHAMDTNLNNSTGLQRLSSREIQLNNSKPIQFGQQVAQSIYRGIDFE